MACVLVLAAAFLWMSACGREADGYSREYVAIAELPSQLSFTGGGEEKWQEVLSELNGQKGLSGTLTYGKLRKLVDWLGIQEQVGRVKGFFWMDVSRPQWNAVYEQALDLLDGGDRVSTKNLVFLEEDGQAAESGKRLTQDGYYEVAPGVDYFHHYDMYQAYVIGKRIIGVSSVCKAPLRLRNVFVHDTENERADVIYDGERISLDMEGLEEEIHDTICDIEWKDGRVFAVYKKEDVISGKVLSFDEEQIEISGYGKLRHGSDLKVYKTYGTVEEVDKSKLVIGNLWADFAVAGKKVCGIILKEPVAIETIRVLLLNEEGGKFHKRPVFSMDTGGTVSAGGKEARVDAGAPIPVAGYWKKKGTDYVTITPDAQEGRIYFADKDGSRLSLGYRGTIEIRKYPKGYGVVNEVPLEEYLYGVVPSEMPASYEADALRAQAVCARSYACIQLMRGDYASMGAHVDDSTNYQVYRKQEEDPRTNRAVDDTMGEVVKYRGEIAETFYFSTSCGYTQNVGVWGLDEGENGYLKGVSLIPGREAGGLAGEEEFADFIKDKDVPAYDSDSAYFRWRARLGIPKRSGEINARAKERASANPEHVRFYAADGQEASPEDFSGFGEITGIDVEERDPCGGIIRLRISYERGSLLLTTEYEIRSVLGAAVTGMKDKNGQPFQISLLPSACFTPIPVKNGYVLYGGGYGHGLGMSQYGANGMAKAGMGYLDILRTFYQGVDVENVY